MSIRILLLLSTLTTLAALHVVFIAFRVYDSISWLDIPVHVFGGAVVGLGILAATDFEFRFLQHLQKAPFAIAALLAIILAWELFGYLYLGSSLRPDYLSDTIIDIVAGFGGGMLGLYIGQRLALIQ